MDKSILNLLDEFNRGLMDRRIFLKRLTILAGSAAAACAMLPMLERKEANAAMIAENDSRLMTETIHYPGADGEMAAYCAKPAADGKFPGVVVIHENRGLNAHIEDVTRRIAVEGYHAIAPDALSSAGGTPPVQEKAIEMIRGLDKETTKKNFLAAVKYLDTSPRTTGKVGVVGFCWGGAMANQMAVNAPELDAAVPYYGMPPADEDVPKIKASLLLHYAGLDERINKAVPAYEKGLKAAGVDYRIYMYEGAKHAFNNDTNPGRYNKEAAELAWKRTMDFFSEKLKE